MKSPNFRYDRAEAEIADLATAQFREFLGELARARTQASTRASVSVDEATKELHRRLLDLLETQMLRAKRDGTRFEVQDLMDACYLKAALADEILLNAEWAGRERWTLHLFESTLFHSNVAGDEVFERIERLLADREPARRRMARLYLFALAVGFQGRFRGTDGLGQLREYREALYEFAYQRRADSDGRDRVLALGAYANTLSHMTPRKLPKFGRRTFVFLLAAGTLLVVSELAWLWQSWSLRAALQALAA